MTEQRTGIRGFRFGSGDEFDYSVPSSSFTKAVHALLDNLTCPKCGAANRPGAHVITIENGVANCSVCAHAWTVSQGD